MSFFVLLHYFADWRRGIFQNQKDNQDGKGIQCLRTEEGT